MENAGDDLISTIFMAGCLYPESEKRSAKCLMRHRSRWCRTQWIYSVRILEAFCPLKLKKASANTWNTKST
ncbi:hypothetical protein ACFPFV_00020 [Salinicoccus siamensis]|uniref:hypothetical protein n=1 Tax=Salinicoccus siamensis TaxID=381830 RepID=UPI0036084156